MNNLAKVADSINFDQVFESGMTDTKDDVIMQMVSENKYFYISGQKFQFEDKDPIYNVEGPCGMQVIYNKKGDGNGDCIVCKEPFKNTGDINYW